MRTGAVEIQKVDESDVETYCIHDEIAIERCNWLTHYRRALRQSDTIPELEIHRLRQILAATGNMAEAIAMALRLAEMEPSGDWFKKACQLAQTSSFGQIENGLWELRERQPFIEATLAYIHYELFNSFEFGQYVVSVELIIKGGKAYRRWTNP